MPAEVPPPPRNVSLPLVAVHLLTSLWMLAATLPALLLLIVAVSWRGRLAGALAVLTAIVPWVTIIALRYRRRVWVIRAVVGSVLWMVALGLIVALAPTGQTNGRVKHSFRDPAQVFPRYSIGNLLPESDQLMYGFAVMPFVDKLLTFSQGFDLRGYTGPIYRELENDADFHALGSVMSDAYGEIFNRPWLGGDTKAEIRAPGSSGGAPTGRWLSGHSYVYVPAAGNKDQPRPVLVFFHGSGGNFKAYLWILSKLADKLGFILVAPSNGMGNWTAEDSKTALDAALDSASRAAGIDRTKVHILGLSNGGLAICHLATLQGSKFASMTLLSPVYATEQIRSWAFADQCRDRPVLVVTGVKDDRCPINYVEENAERIKNAGARLTVRKFAQADHFLMFSHREELLELLEQWFHGELRPT